MSHPIACTISQQTFPVNYNCYIQSGHEKFTSVHCYPHTKHRHNIHNIYTHFTKMKLLSSSRLFLYIFIGRWRAERKQKHYKPVISILLQEVLICHQILQRALFLAALLLITSWSKTVTFTLESVVLLILSNQYCL